MTIYIVCAGSGNPLVAYEDEQEARDACRKRREDLFEAATHGWIHVQEIELIQETPDLEND